MQQAAIFSGAFAGIALLVMLCARGFDRRLSVAAAVLVAAYLGLDDFVTGLPSSSAGFRFVDTQWNWSGKVYSLLLAMVVIVAAGIGRRAAGLTLAQRNLRASWIGLGALAAWGLVLGFLFEPGAASTETLAFQALMPGAAEELAYRGIAPVLLLGLRDRNAPQGIPWTAVIALSVVFGLWHGLAYTQGGFAFDPVAAVFPFIGSVAAGWLRFNSGSLLFPILAHNASNLAFHLSAWLTA
jgi:uncharacterized protein